MCCFAILIPQAYRKRFFSWVHVSCCGFLHICCCWFQIKHIIVRSGTNYWYGLLLLLLIQPFSSVHTQNSAKRGAIKSNEIGKDKTQKRIKKVFLVEYWQSDFFQIKCINMLQKAGSLLTKFSTYFNSSFLASFRFLFIPIHTWFRELQIHPFLSFKFSMAARAHSSILSADISYQFCSDSSKSWVII